MNEVYTIPTNSKLVGKIVDLRDIQLEDLQKRVSILEEQIKTFKAEPKRGRWIPSDKGDCIYTCSECGFVRDAYLLNEKAYCPRCGVDMREVEE